MRTAVFKLFFSGIWFLMYILLYFFQAGQNQEISDGINVPIEAFLEEEQADDKRKRGKLLGCFGFIRVWMEKRRMKRIEKELMKKSNADANKNDLDFSDIVVKIPHSARSYDADDIY